MNLLSLKSPYKKSPYTNAIIVAMTEGRIIGVDGTLPWSYPADLKRFKELTTGAAVIMGRRTWESIGCKPLSGRQNIVLTSQQLDLPNNVYTAPSIAAAGTIQKTPQRWFIGGKRVYEEALQLCDTIDATIIPDQIADDNAVKFPEIPNNFILQSEQLHPYDQRLKVRRYVRTR